jgi:adenylate cyclase
MKHLKIFLFLLLTLGCCSVYAQGQGEQRILDSLLLLLPEQKEDTNKVKLLDAISHNFGDLYPDGSIKYEMMELDLAQKLNFELYIARAHMHLGNDYLTKSEYEKSFRHMQQSILFFKKVDHRSLLKLEYINVGILYERQEKYDSALLYYDSSVKTPDYPKDRSKTIFALYQISAIHNILNNHDSVLAQGYKAINITNQINDQYNATNTSGAWARYMAGITGFIGEAYLSKTGKPGNAGYNITLDSAMHYLEKAVAENEAATRRGYYDDINNFALAVRFSRKLSIAYIMAGKSEQAIKNIVSSGIIADSFTKELGSQGKNMREIVNHVNEEKILVEQKELRAEKKNKALLIGGIVLLVILLVLIFRSFSNQVTANKLITAEKKRSEDLLLNILPAEVAEELKAKGSTEAKLIDEVTVLFTDFKGFTQLSEKLSPKELVGEINTCFSAFDNIMQKHGVEKIKTIGDAYMAAGGLPTPNTTHAEDVIKAALDIQAFMHRHKAEREAEGKLFFEIRIGVHTGPVVAGIVGIKKFAYDIWGDTVNTASRMESSGSVGKVNISETTYEMVKDKFACAYRGEVEAKGKGVMKMYYVS